MSSHGIPEVLMKKADKYVDSLTPQIQLRIASELDIFQQKTIDSLETQVIDAFRGLFGRHDTSNPGVARSIDAAVPDTYGGQSMPFATEIANLTGSFGKIVDEAGDDVRDIFGLAENQLNSGGTRSFVEGSSDPSQLARGFLSTAVQAVQDHLDNNNNNNNNNNGGLGIGGQKLELDGLLGIFTTNLKDIVRSPEDAARCISPEIKERVSIKLREQHGPIAEQFTRIALDHIKRWLRGNTSAHDIGVGARGEIEEHVKGFVKGIGDLFGNKREDNEGFSRGFGDCDSSADEDGRGGGFSKVISEKLSIGLARVHRDVRLEFRKVLGGIEKQLFELLPDELQGSLEKILGGNPFDSQLQRDAGIQQGRGFGDNIRTKLVEKIRGLVLKMQKMLRESILSVVNGGHRKLERQSWVFVQNIVEEKVQRYLPKVKITVPDDIGNEGVSIGAPNPSAQLEQSHQPNPSSQHEYQQGHSADYYQDQHQYQSEHRPGQYPPSHQSSYRVDQHYNLPGHQQNQTYQGSQWHSQNSPY